MDRIGEIDLAIVLGSGLSSVVSGRDAFDTIPFAEIGMPVATLAGHAGHALVGRWHGKRVLVFAGRVHAYQGFDARDVTRNVAIAAEHGASTLFITNAAGGLRPDLAPGDLMVITDHLNLTGLSPLTGTGTPNPFTNMNGAYSRRLRELAHASDGALRDGVYAGLVGPAYETPAEARYLQRIGADAVGMSTVLETIAARARNLEVFGLSLITNSVASQETSHEEVTEAARRAAPRIGALLDELVRRS